MFKGFKTHTYLEKPHLVQYGFTLSPLNKAKAQPKSSFKEPNMRP